MNPKRPFLLAVILLAQLFCTSIWFASNAVLEDLSIHFSLPSSSLGPLTSAVQFGFIVGTLLSSFFYISDRYPSTQVFFFSSLLGALSTSFLALDSNNYTTLLLFRFLTGVSLAGVYPVGMKIAANHSAKHVGSSLGFLVGALVLGTASPHLFKQIIPPHNWPQVLYLCSGLAILGGFLLFISVPKDSAKKQGTLPSFQPSKLLSLFQSPPLRQAAFGYFGHMAELYAFWAFTPLFLSQFNQLHGTAIPLPLASFAIIAMGSLGCLWAGILSQKTSPKTIAGLSLLGSLLCCLSLPLFFHIPSPFLFLMFLLFWGFFVVADSPMFATLLAQKAPTKLQGTTLTLVNCIGYMVTILSIESLLRIQIIFPSISTFSLLALGPCFGLYFLLQKPST